MSPTYHHLTQTVVVLFLMPQSNLVNTIFAHPLQSTHLDMVFEPLQSCNFIISTSPFTDPGGVLTIRRLAFHSARIERTVQVFTEPARYSREKTLEKYSNHCYVQLQVTLETDGGKLMHNPLHLPENVLAKFNDNAHVYFDIFLVFFVASPVVPPERHWVFVSLVARYCLQPSNMIWFRISAQDGQILGSFQLETLSGATRWNSGPGKTIADYRSKVAQGKVNYNGFRAVIQYIGARAYHHAARMNAVQIIKDAYPWQVVMKLIQGLMERFNVTIVDGGSHVTKTCSPAGIVMASIPTEWFDSNPTIEFLTPDMDACGALYHDRADTLPPHPFYDLTAPFSKFLWAACLGSAAVMVILFHVAYDLSPLTALVTAIAPFVSVVFPIRTQRSRLLFIAWACGGGLISTAYVSTLQSYVTVPKEKSNLKSVGILVAEKYRIYGDQSHPTFGMYDQAYKRVKQKIGNDPTAQKLLHTYEQLLSMYDKGFLGHFDRYLAMRDGNVALFGELHELNVIRGALPPNERKRYNLVNETFFPKPKNWNFQLPHANLFARELNWLVSTGIHRWWENVRGMANRLRWRRLLKNVWRQAEQRRQSVAFDDSLSLATFYCLLLGYFLAICASILEFMHFCATRKRWRRADRVEAWIQVKEISEGRYR